MQHFEKQNEARLRRQGGLGMKSRERLLCAMNRKETDRVPLDLGGTSVTTLTRGVLAMLERHSGSNSGGKEGILISRRFQNVLVPEEYLLRFNVDVRGVTPGKPEHDTTRELEDGSWIDEWGITYAPSAGGLYNDIVRYPLAAATAAELDAYPWPDPDDPGRTKSVREKARTILEHTEYAAVGNMTGSQIFERCWYLRGFEEFLLGLHSDRSFAHRLLRIVTDIQMRRTENFLREAGPYIQVFKTSDDLCGQLSPLISPSMYREMIKPYHREYFALVRSLTDARILLHCCGNVRPLLPELIDTGIDIIHPFQFSCPDMDPVSLKREFGDDIVFWGGMDVQTVLPRFPADEVRRRTGKIIDIMSPGGGFVLSPTHNIQPDTPAENIVAMYEAATQS